MEEQFKPTTNSSELFSSEDQKEYYKNLIEKEQEKLKEFFLHYLPTEFHPKNIMSFCCGVANEEPVLRELYGDNVSLVSFDHSEHMIQIVEDLSIERKSLIKLDMKEMDDYFKNAKFDLLLGRNIPINPNHQSNYFHHNEKYPDDWPQFLENFKKYLESNGYLLMTFAREDEFERAEELLKKLKYNIIIQEKNGIVIPSDRIGIAGAGVKDNYVIKVNLP